MKLISLFLGVTSLLLLTSCFAGKKVQIQYTVASYNVENLFDTINNPNKLDDEFTPAPPKEWNTARYQKKIDDLSQVIQAIDSVHYPVLVGLYEIENDLVLTDLIKSKRLQKIDYGFVWHEGPDMRGIDCGLLYDKKRFKLIQSEFLPVINPEDTAFKTREIIHATGKMGNEVFHVFVNHWPSRREGAEVSASKRDLAATTLRKKIDQLYAEETSPNIIIMGDMNDEPGDSSLLHVLGALANDQTPQPNQLVNLMYDEFSKGEGSYSYKGQWDMIDNLIVSSHLILKSKGLKTTLDDGHVFSMPFMEFKNNKGEVSPNRTYGRTYFGGISDHFPVYFILKK